MLQNGDLRPPYCPMQKGNGESLLSFAQRSSLMAVSGTHWRKQTGEGSSLSGDLQEYGSLEPVVSIRSIEATAPARTHSQLGSNRLVGSADNFEVLDEPVEPRDEAGSGPPAIEVAAESADVAQELKLPSDENRRAVRRYFGEDNISLRKSTPASNGHPSAVIAE